MTDSTPVSLPDHSLPESACPFCGHKMDHAFSTQTDNPPTPGDFSLCIRCGRVLRFAEDMTLLKVEREEMETLDTETLLELERASDLIKRANAAAKRRGWRFHIF